MKILRAATLIVSVLMALGEIGRWWGDPRFVPLAFDELTVAAAMAIAAILAPKAGAVPLAAAWALFCGLNLGLLVTSLDHLFFGPPKDSAVFYSVVLAAMLAAGAWATFSALRTSTFTKSGTRSGRGD